jgi:hypothetical protein
MFKLSGNPLTARAATEHAIPTPTILKGYRLAEVQQQEITRQVIQMLNDDIITSGSS